MMTNRIILSVKHFTTLDILTVYSLKVYETVVGVQEQIVILKLVYHHKYFTRNRNKLCIQKHNRKLDCKKTSHMGTKFYNQMPAGIRLESNVNKFNLLMKALYSIEYFAQ